MEKNLKSLGLLAIVLVTLGAVIAFVPKNKTHSFKLTPEQLLEKIKSGSQFIEPDSIAKLMIKKDPTLQLIDVRNPEQFAKFSLTGAVNVPLTKLLDEKFTDNINQPDKMIVLYSNGNVESIQAWMLIRQFGYENVFVLQGGLNYWFDVIMNPQKPSNTNSNEEIAKYEFRVGASKALGGGDNTAVKNNTIAPPAGGSKPAGGGEKKKKGASGGC